MDKLQLDLACAIARMEQAYEDPDSMEFLVQRMATCDAPRLREYLTPEAIEALEAAKL